MSNENAIVSGNDVGQLSQEMEETLVVWKIPDFVKKLSEPPGTTYSSPTFAFSDRCWFLSIYPSGDDREYTKGYTGLYLNLNGKHGCKITYTLSIRNAKGVSELPFNITHMFDSLNESLGRSQVCLKSTLMSRKSELLPNDTLTVECRLKRSDSTPLGASRIGQLLNLQRDLKKILTKKENCDVVLKLDGQEIKAHKVILENRCKMFESMLSHDMVERTTEEITIDDIQPDVFQEILAYMYCGEVKNLTAENVCDLYVDADKYHLDELKRLCATFIAENLSVDLFCDVIAIPDTCIDSELMLLLNEFLRKNLMSIIVTEKWKHFYEENRSVTQELLLSTLKANSEKSIVLHKATEVSLNQSKTDAAMKTMEDTAVSSVPSEIEDAVALRNEFEAMYQTGEFCDFDVKVEDRIFRTHKMVLAARSSALASMLSHDMKEKKTGMVEIVDCDSKTFEVFLKFLYCGKYDVIVPKNVVSLYEVADKYNVQNLKAMCLCFMRDNLSPELFCDVMSLALRHDEKDLIKHATEYFKLNKKSIFLSVEWQIFMKENNTYANELLIKTCVE